MLHTAPLFPPASPDTCLLAVYDLTDEDDIRLLDVLDDNLRTVPSAELCGLLDAATEADALAVAHDLSVRRLRDEPADELEPEESQEDAYPRPRSEDLFSREQLDRMDPRSGAWS